MNRTTFSFSHACNRCLLFIAAVTIIVCTASCQNKNKEPVKGVLRDTSITVTNAYSNIFFDSLALEKMIRQRKITDSTAQKIRNFYNSRNYQYAWFNNKGFTEQTSIFWNLQSNYIQYSGDSALYNHYLQQLMDSAEATNNMLHLPDSVRLDAELQFTRQFVHYVQRAYQGNISFRDKDLNWFIPRKQINTAALLDSFLKNKEPYEPVNGQYGLLKKFLIRYYQVQQQGGWPIINTKIKKLQAGDTSAVVTLVKKRLAASGDFSSTDTSRLFTDSLKKAVQHFQKRFGLKEDGLITGNTLTSLSQPVEEQIRKILINMERIRWLPQNPKTDFIIVNIPQFKLIAFEAGKPVFDMNIVVGKTQNRTVVFTGNIKYVVFRPYWNVPSSILRKEILPAIRRNPNYLERHNMEWSGGRVRQRPGLDNALGKVKFLFPNNYNIYLHDTPVKSLFEEQTRTFSHGCIRIEKPELMANWLLRNQKEWTPDKIKNAMEEGNERFVLVKKQVPVFIVYFTAFVDQAGLLNFRDDIYGHDKEMAQHLFPH